LARLNGAFRRTVGLVQNDIKRVIAYSTCSQLGFMFVALGAGAYGVGIFHLFTHAFFKALLFLGAVPSIHAMHHEQDMRKMGGLARLVPWTTAAMLDRHPGADRLPADGRLFLQGCHRRDGLCHGHRRPRLCLSAAGC
jgi:NADH:ubiquinone oxidoreductase subunit 4 (subunit M)